MTLLDSTLVGEPCVASPAVAEGSHVLVLGVGNVLMGDEGVGVHVLRTLELEPTIRGVRLLDGGTGGVNLLTEFDGVSAIVLVAMALRLPTAGSLKASKLLAGVAACS